jgi:hypothetical protein
VRSKSSGHCRCPLARVFAHSFREILSNPENSTLLLLGFIIFIVFNDREILPSQVDLTAPSFRSTTMGKTKTIVALKVLRKSRTGIRELDEITCGGLPAGRPTLVCGAAGCGKTLLAMEFLVRGATEYDEPGVFMAFEETGEELAWF